MPRLSVTAFHPAPVPKLPRSSKSGGPLPRSENSTSLGKLDMEIALRPPPDDKPNHSRLPLTSDKKTVMDHFRPGRGQQYVRRCPLRPESDRGAVLPRNDAIGQLRHRLAYSITSLAVASRYDGIVRPSALAVVRLTTKSNLVGRSIGISAGFSPLRTRPQYRPVSSYTSTKLGP